MMIDTIAIRIKDVYLKEEERKNYKHYKYNPYKSFTINKFYKNVKVGNCTAKLTFVVSYQNNHLKYYLISKYLLYLNFCTGTIFKKQRIVLQIFKKLLKK